MGDQVEVAWKGKFRLESLEVYDGTAWWIGEVVDKSESPGNYKVCTGGLFPFGLHVKANLSTCSQLKPPCLQ